MDVKKNTGTLYLLPTPLSESGPEKVLPAFNLEIIARLRHFIVEEIRSGRRFLKKALPEIDLEGLRFMIYNEHTDTFDLSSYLEPLENGEDVGLLSEAGLPCIADPGAAIVALAHRRHIRVVPLTGPSSILLALMASGFNGQRFAFHGYLPVERSDRVKKIREMEHSIYTGDEVQVFIETPYRNQQLFDALISNLRNETMLCIGLDLTSGSENITVMEISEWKMKMPALHKKPAVFLLYHGWNNRV
jgi:16S rRNA (cytidine1402-2'-O)-methyltransferase